MGGVHDLVADEDARGGTGHGGPDGAEDEVAIAVGPVVPGEG